MEENLPPTIRVGEKIYIKLENENTPSTSRFMDFIINMQK